MQSFTVPWEVRFAFHHIILCCLQLICIFTREGLSQGIHCFTLKSSLCTAFESPFFVMNESCVLLGRFGKKNVSFKSTVEGIDYTLHQLLQLFFQFRSNTLLLEPVTVEWPAVF